MPDDVLLNKSEIIENCLRRIATEYANNPDNLYLNQTKQDAILLNIERACQACIDISMRIVRLRKLGLPKETREAFDLLEKAGIIDSSFCRQMHGLVGFRNTAIHNYKKLDLKIVEALVTKHLEDFRKMARIGIRI